MNAWDWFVPNTKVCLKSPCNRFLNIFVEDIAKTPEGAKAVFQQAIEEVQERYNKAGDTLNRFVGEQSSVQKNLNKLYGELKDVESKCESLVRSGNMADAAIFSTRREEILFEISQKEGYLRELEPMVKEAQAVYEAYDKKLRELKKQSRMTVEEMKLRGNMKDLLGDLDELRRDSATDKLLGSVRDGAEDLRKEVDGAIVVHASRTTTKMSMAEKNAAKAQSDAYLQSLATKYSGKPAIRGWNVLTSILRRQARASTATILAGCWSIASMCMTSSLGLWLAILNWRSHRRRWRSLRCSTI